MLQQKSLSPPPTLPRRFSTAAYVTGKTELNFVTFIFNRFLGAQCCPARRMTSVAMTSIAVQASWNRFLMRKSSKRRRCLRLPSGNTTLSFDELNSRTEIYACDFLHCVRGIQLSLHLTNNWVVVTKDSSFQTVFVLRNSENWVECSSFTSNQVKG